MSSKPHRLQRHIADTVSKTEVRTTVKEQERRSNVFHQRNSILNGDYWRFWCGLLGHDGVFRLFNPDTNCWDVPFKSA